jgi:hypothetical protein
MQLQLSDILSIIGSIAILVGLIFSIRQIVLLNEQVKLMTKEINEQLSWRRKDATFHYLYTYISDFKEINERLEKHIGFLKHDGASVEPENMSKLLSDASIRTDLFHSVAYLENLAIGISHDYFNEPIAKALLYNIVISNFESLKPYLLFRRKETGLAVGSNFEKLAIKWKNINNIKSNV